MSEDPDIEKFRRFKEAEDKNKARIKAERRRQNRIKQEQEATLEQASDEKKSKKPTGKVLGETLTTDYNGAPLEVRKITGGCLLKPLQGYCVGPSFLLDEPSPIEQPKEKKKKSKTMTKSQMQIIELRNA